MTRRNTLAAIAVFAGVTSVVSAVSMAVSEQPAAPDVIYYNGKIVTVDDKFSYAQAVAITGDKFTAVGSNDAVRKLAGAADQAGGPRRV